MRFRSALDLLTSHDPRTTGRRKRRGPARRRPTSRRMQLEPLEDRRLLSLSAPVEYAVGSNPEAVTTADFNGDGRLDLAVANYSSGTVSLLLGNADGTFQPALSSATGAYPRSLAVGDFNADGKLDLATANMYDVSVLRGNGDGTFGAPASIGLGSTPHSVAVGDFNADGKLDLGVTSNLYVIDGIACGYYSCGYYGHCEGRAHVLLGNGGGAFATPNTAELGYGYHTGTAAADFNGDGRDDFATLNSDYAKLRVLAANPDNSGSLLGPTDYATGAYPQSVVLGDVNGDGIRDLITRDSSSVSVLLGNGAVGVGDGTFQPAQTTPLDVNPTSLAVGDLNADGKLDLVATSVWVVDGYSCGYYGCYPSGHYEGRVNVLLGHGNGTFTTPHISAINGTRLPGVAAGDFNADGFADVAAALPPTSPNGYTNSVSVLINTQDWRSFTVSGMPSSTTAGDVQTITVTALATDLSVLTGYTGTVHFTSSDAQAALPADYTFTAGDNGTHTFTVTLKTAGAQSLTVVDTTTPDFVGSQGGIVVNPAAASSFVLAEFPPTTTSENYGYFSVTATDPYGNRATSYTGTVHFTSSDALATLPADYTFTSYDGGIAGFSAALRTVGTQSITATDTANSSVTGTQAGIRVVPRATVSGPYYAVRNQTLTFTLEASGGLPASTVFSYAIDWNNDGVVDQNVSGPSGTTVDHSFAFGGYYYIAMTATVSVGGEDYTSYPAYQSVYVLEVSVTIQTDPGDSTKSALVVEGTADAETFVLSPGTGNGVALSYNGYELGTFSAPDGAAFAHVLVYGYGESDSIQLTGGLAVPAFLFGGGGSDTLDARGSIANNVLIGGAGGDRLYGGSGRDLLIGGLGADTLKGGGGHDILIGGSTDYDAHLTALCAVMNEWGRTDADYSTRVKHLSGTLSGGLNGPYFLNTTTVHDDNAVDSLYGEAGLDWFFARKKGAKKDKVNDLSSGEVVTAIS